MTIEELNKIVKAFNNNESCCINFNDITIYSLSDTYIEVYADNCLMILNKKSPELSILSIHNILEYNLTIEKEKWHTCYILKKENK